MPEKDQFSDGNKGMLQRYNIFITKGQKYQTITIVIEYDKCATTLEKPNKQQYLIQLLKHMLCPVKLVEQPDDYCYVMLQFDKR